MLRHSLMLAATAIGLAVLPSVADAAPARITANINVRSGPGVQYYRIGLLPAGSPVEVYGCLQGYTWCDVSYGNMRGWVAARYLSVFYNRNVFVPSRPIVALPFLSFSYSYWDNHYRDQPWYAYRPRPGRPGWDNPPPRDWRPNPPGDWRSGPPRDWRNDPPRDWRNGPPRGWRNDPPRLGGPSNPGYPPPSGVWLGGPGKPDQQWTPRGGGRPHQWTPPPGNPGTPRYMPRCLPNGNCVTPN